MIYGIGVDLCSIRRVQNIKDLNKFANKILTSGEIKYLDTLDQKNSVNYLAKQFAAKEALSKALGTGLTGDVKLRGEFVFGNGLLKRSDLTTGLSTITSSNPQFPAKLKVGNILKLYNCLTINLKLQNYLINEQKRSSK